MNETKFDKLKREEERMKILQEMANKQNHRTNVFQFLHSVSLNGLGVLFAFGAWGGIYIVSNGGGYRLGLGWLAITVLPFDGDILMEVATRGFVKQFVKAGMKNKAKFRQKKTESQEGDDTTLNQADGFQSGQADDPRSAEQDSTEKMNQLLDDFFRKNKEDD